MRRHAVWAPQAQQVDLVLHPGTTSQSTVVLTRSEGGWWRHDGPASPHGTDYAYRVDDGDLTPDPRSAWQPHGVHGPSRIFDADEFHWTDQAWRGPRGGRGGLGGVIYELHVGTFTAEGTLDAAIERFDHLVALGVDLVELMPIAAFDGRVGWGYDAVHAYSVHEPYGGPSALQRFVDAAHARGLGVCLDVMYNHLGPSGNYLARFGPYFAATHHTPWGAGINVDGEGNLAVRRWMIDNALRWFRDFHIDALRLDAIHEIHDNSPAHVLAQLSDETRMLSKALGRPLTLIAETDRNDPRTIEKTDADGLGMSAQWADDVHHALHACLTGERQGYYVDFGSLPVLAACLTRVFRHDGGWSTFREQPWGQPIDPQRHRGHAFIAYLQSHDQIGNRALGERISSLVTPGQQAIGAALVLLGAYTPMIFMGEEWATRTPWNFFTDFSDPNLAEAVRTGRRREFTQHGWAEKDIPDPQLAATFSRSRLRWDEVRHADHQRMLDWYHALIRLRRKQPDFMVDALTDIQVSFDEPSEWLIMSRGSLRVVANLAENTQEIELDREPVDVLLCWDPASTSLTHTGVHLGPHSVAVMMTQS